MTTVTTTTPTTPATRSTLAREQGIAHLRRQIRETSITMRQWERPGGIMETDPARYRALGAQYDGYQELLAREMAG
jgi:hypothetical protein